ncbi:MAG: glycosyltransferase WbuB [Magnetovibrio sp.]|nr:glycosyltransferase WbuB [Magnetovibrio sp.]
MKIQFISENFPPESNAAASRVYERACYWVKWGHQVTVITSAPNFPEGKLFPGYKNDWKQFEIMSGIKVVRVKTYIAANEGIAHRTFDFLSFMVTGFFAALKDERPDIIVATSPQFFTTVAGWAAGALRNVPFIFELGDLWPASIEAVGVMKKNIAFKLIEKLELFLYRRSTQITALSPSFKENLVKRGIDKNKITVVINGVDLARYKPQARNLNLSKEWGLDKKFVIGYIGTHGMAHALCNVLNAAEILKYNDTIRFLFVGAGAERSKLMEHAEKNKIDNVIFMPRQPKKRMPAIWSLCDVALVHLKNSPVFSEVIPSKIFEAQAMGLPILLAAPEGEASRIIMNDKSGIHVPAEDPKALASGINKLASNKSALKTFATAALRTAPTHSRETQAYEMLTVLKETLRARA